MKTLGEKLKLYRKNKGLSQEKIAELVGVSRQAVTKWENNQTIPSSDNLITLSSIFDVSLDELVADKQNEQQLNDKILHANLTLIAIILQIAFLNVAMKPSLDVNDISLTFIDLLIKFIPLLTSSLWMACNLRYEKNSIQYKKNTKIEMIYCIIQLSVMLYGHYSQLYFIGTVLLIAVGMFYISIINPKYMNRQLIRTK